ncbi:hypothetical protein AWZ03_010448 [Drosophila navojoa]|uniref:Uncharacterized protein n=1 Tax=Drosophila navojoa TaxID=7232 RepID=A0A484B2L3_DRONA|nr:hypothetical protein AWZ03_010448 [Drosophila navojoa]
MHTCSTALGFYTPVKASPMDSLFQLGVTRSPSAVATNGGSSSNNNSSSSSSFNGNGNGSIVGISEGLLKDGENGESGVKDAKDAAGADDDVDDFLTAGGIVYSEGTQKTDLLY